VALPKNLRALALLRATHLAFSSSPPQSPLRKTPSHPLHARHKVRRLWGRSQYYESLKEPKVVKAPGSELSPRQRFAKLGIQNLHTADWPQLTGTLPWPKLRSRSSWVLKFTLRNAHLFVWLSASCWTACSGHMRSFGSHTRILPTRSPNMRTCCSKTSGSTPAELHMR